MKYKRYEIIVKRGRLYVQDTYYRGKDKNKFVLVADVKLLKKIFSKLFVPSPENLRGWILETKDWEIQRFCPIGFIL